MTLHLLLDLDDTLLNSNIEALIPVYFQKLVSHLSQKIAPDQTFQHLITGTRIMYASADPLCTLEQSFNDAFYPALNVERETIAPLIEEFYDTLFPTLQPLTSPRPDAIAFVEWAFTRGWKVAVATDPLFPRKAILHRLRWANLAPETYPFSLIPDFETFHFAKVSHAYYPEFLLRLGWQNEPALMVGDSLERDIFPAQQAGLPVFWLRPSDQADSRAEGIPQGTFDDLRRWLETVDFATLVPHFTTRKALRLALLAAPAALHTLTLKVPAAQWIVRPAPEEWAFTEILCHLRDVECEVNLPRFQFALKNENAFIPGQDTDPWAAERRYLSQDGLQAFLAYASARQELLALFATFTAVDWERKVRHTIFGPTTLRELAGIMNSHNQSHVHQALQTLNWI